MIPALLACAGCPNRPAPARHLLVELLVERARRGPHRSGDPRPAGPPRRCAPADRASDRMAMPAAAIPSTSFGRTQEAADAVLDHLGQAAHARGDHGHLAGHGLERRQAEALVADGNRNRSAIERNCRTSCCSPSATTSSPSPSSRARRQRVRQVGAVADQQQHARAPTRGSGRRRRPRRPRA